MDLLLSLPIVSYFLAPTVTSWSTSLNLLFFYMTWSTLVLSHGPLKIELLGTLCLRIVFWLLPSLFFLLFDTLVPSLSESIKHGGAAALPPGDAAALARLFLLSLLNLSLETAAEAGCSLGLATLLRTSSVFRTGTTLPLPWQMIKHIAFLVTAREALTYYAHRFILHAPSGSRGRWLANQHRRFAHARSAPPFALLVAADYPVAFLLQHFVPVYVPALLLRRNLHLLTYFLFVGLCTVEETMSTSGYSVVPGIVMGGIARRTAMHYASGGKGNFGAWGLLDWMHGTSVGKDVMADVRDEAEKHRVKEKGENALQDAGMFVQDGIDGFRKGSRGKGRKGRKRASSSE